MNWDNASIVGPRRLVRLIPSLGCARYSICVMTTCHEELQECLAAFQLRGFTQLDCEYLIVDNSCGNVADAYIAVNEFLQSSGGERVIIAHQDVVLLKDGRLELDDALSKLDLIDPNWALCGNAGFSRDGWPVLYLSHPYGDEDITGGPFPAPVVSLDENFIVVKRVSNLSVSRDLSGFHHYGADLCTIADVLGWNSYVIKFFLHHKSAGKIDQSYDVSRRAIASKYRRAFRPRWVHVVTRRPFYLSGRISDIPIAIVKRRIGKLLGRIPRVTDFD